MTTFSQLSPVDQILAANYIIKIGGGGGRLRMINLIMPLMEMAIAIAI